MNQSTVVATTQCRVCGVVQESSGFYSDRSKALGHGTECKSCVRARTRSRYLADTDAWKKRSAANKAADPERYRSYNREYAQRNRSRTADREREYRNENRERYSQHSRNWYARNRDLARELGRLSASVRRSRTRNNGIFSVDVRDLNRLLHRYGNACAYCGSRFGQANRLEWDHVLPVVRGGRHSIGNFVPSCGDCNRAKSHRTVMEWRAGKVVPRDLQSLTVL